MAIIFSDGFESNDFSAWTDTQVTGVGSTITVESIDPHHGTYHCKAYTNTSAANAWVWKDIAEQSTCYGRAYIKILSNLPSTPSDYYHPLGLFANSGATGLAYAAVYNDGGTVKWILRYRNGANLLNSISSVTVSLDTWYCVELKVVVDGSVGEAILYIDGSAVATETSIDTDNYGNVDRFVTGERYATRDTVHSIYVDCVVVADARIYCESAVSIPVMMHHYNRINKIIRG